jgi:predicted O-linked N-acetylglucosamine transferase (SPINDLY family)
MMATIPETLAIAVRHHQAGRLQAAEQIYRQVLEAEPNHADALHLLGVLAHQNGRHALAIETIQRAIGLKGNAAAFHSNLGGAYHALQRLPEAIACYRRALKLKPDYAEAANNLGNALKDQGSLEEAIACYRQALELQPDYAQAHNNLGNALKDQGELEEAVICYRRAAELQPDNVEAHNNMGTAFQGLGKLEEAVACYRRALELRPEHATAHSNLGAAFHIQGKLEEAVACYRRALELRPDYVLLPGVVGPSARAGESSRGAVKLLSNLGNALRDLGRLDEAVVCLRRALDLNPDFAASLGSLLHAIQHLCRWEDLETLSRRAIEIVERDATAPRLLSPARADGPTTPRSRPGGVAFPLSPFTVLSLPLVTTAEQQLRSARQWVDRQLRAASGSQKSEVRGQRSEVRPPTSDRRPITVGYLSADFHAHATAWLIAELIEKHDRRQVAVYGYSYGADDGSATRRRLVAAFDRFVDLKDASFADAAERIAADEVDILVDLKGYTKDCRTEILALRPAPIQVNYLGYPGTMGAEFIDYILVDDYIVPPDQQRFFTEKLVHLPGCYQVNDSRRETAARTPSRQECGLPPGGSVFCSFNNSYKITPEMFEAWMRLLAAVPGSLLWLLESNRFVPANLRREAAARGVAPQRLVFAPSLPLPEHLARHRVADLFLDTFPVNAHTTASDALWAGLPVLTLSGQTMVSRVAGSLLRTMGLPELITTSLEDYEATALRLARDGVRLAELRARLEANRATCGLFDGARFARNLEKAYATMWDIYRAGGKPRAFAVNPM